VTLEGSAELWDMVGVPVRSPGCVDRVFVRAGVAEMSAETSEVSEAVRMVGGDWVRFGNV
jgi:hypothetical protein